jgi:hypothetical protein
MKRFALLLSVLFLLPVASAHADPFTPEAEAEYAAAVQYWGHEPSLCSSVTKELDAGALPEQSEDSGSEVLGSATQPNSEFAPVKCTITVDSDLEPWAFCRVMRHEVGHLEGNGHSGDPTNIMYPYMTRAEIAPGCPEPPPASVTYQPREPIPVLVTTYNHWMREVARCSKIAASATHRRASLCWEIARAYRWEYEEESGKY